MSLMHSEYAARVNHWMRVLAEDFYRPLGEIALEGYTTMDHLSPEEAALLSAQACLWGCDLCQRVCPYNAHPAITPISDFREDLIPSLSPADLEGLTNRTFREKYGDRAFAWRGPAVLWRNLALKEPK